MADFSIYDNFSDDDIDGFVASGQIYPEDAALIKKNRAGVSTLASALPEPVSNNPLPLSPEGPAMMLPEPAAAPLAPMSDEDVQAGMQGFRIQSPEEKGFEQNADNFNNILAQQGVGQIPQVGTSGATPVLGNIAPNTGGASSSLGDDVSDDVAPDKSQFTRGDDNQKSSQGLMLNSNFPSAPSSKGVDDAFNKHLSSIDEGAAAQLQQNQTVVDINKLKAQKEAELAEQRRVAEEQHYKDQEAAMEEIRKENEKLDKEKVDPSHWWSSRDAFQKTAAIFAVILGGFGQGLMKTKNNAALGVIQNQIDNDINAQRLNLQQQLSVVARKERWTKDKMDIAYQRMNSTLLVNERQMLSTFVAEAEEISKNAKDAKVRASAEQAKSQLLLVKAENEKRQADARYQQNLAFKAKQFQEVKDAEGRDKLPLQLQAAELADKEGNKDVAKVIRDEYQKSNQYDQGMDSLLQLGSELKDASYWDRLNPAERGKWKTRIDAAASQLTFQFSGKAATDKEFQRYIGIMQNPWNLTQKQRNEAFDEVTRWLRGQRPVTATGDSYIRKYGLK